MFTPGLCYNTVQIAVSSTRMNMDPEELQHWFSANRALLETAYIAGREPWQQSGVGLRTPRSAEWWEAVRRPIADSIDRPGTLLDIGCANGYLLECVMRWVGKRDLAIVPYGLDFSEKLVGLARERIPGYADHIFLGNAWDWNPPRRFTFVRTNLEYLPEMLHQAYVTRLLDLFVEPGGKLLVAEYRSHENTEPELAVDRYLTSLGFVVSDVKTGYGQGVEQTRVAAVTAL